MRELKPRNRKPLCWRILRMLLVGLVLAGALLVIERWRGQWALKHWKQQMAAKGEVFEPSRLWPPVSSRSVEFSNQLARLAARSWGGLGNYAGKLSPIVAGEAGQFRRGSQEPLPPLFNGNSTNTWWDLDGLVAENGPRLQSLRELMKDASPAINYDIIKCLEHDSFPYVVGQRMGAQAFQTAVMNDLHKGDLAAVVPDLAALLAFAKFNEQDPMLVSYMMRIAILGLSVDVCWDALQAEGWTELELAALQRACLDSRRMLSQMPRTLEAERVHRLYYYRWFRSHSYDSWIARFQPYFEGFGARPLAAETTGWGRNSRQWFFHPVWSFAWADQEELEYLRYAQRELSIVRDGVQRRSWLQLNEQRTANRQSYRPPTAAWRFYTTLPMIDTLVDVVSGQPYASRENPYPAFIRPWQTTMKNLTLHELVVTAIALKRYQLEHGTPPARLDDLVPDFLAAPPIDFMDGQRLRYQRNSDDSFTLYSIGDDLKDDGGDVLLEASFTNLKNTSPWYANDWVWPRVARAKPSQVADARTQNGRQ